jgi:hypothetical protein
MSAPTIVYVAWCTVHGPFGADTTRADARLWVCGARTARSGCQVNVTKYAQAKFAEREVRKVRRGS